MKRIVWLVTASMVLGSTALGADKKVERLWKAKCASCHGRDGKGETEKGKKMKIPDMTTAEFQKTTDEDIRKQITDGVKTEKDGVKKEMDAFKDEVNGELLTEVVAYIRAFKK
jgi:mono/diheme cytochrome c family protein